MARVFIVFTFVLFLLSCSNHLNDPFEHDADLEHNPVIVSVTPVDSIGFQLELDYSYSSTAIMLFERKANGSYESITLNKINAITYADTTLDMELDHVLTYRLKVQKGTQYTDYSNEKTCSYLSVYLKPPTNLTVTDSSYNHFVIDWTNHSGQATAYQIERKLGDGGFTLLATVSSNVHTYTDNITANGTYQYRVKAKKNNIYSTYSNVISSSVSVPLTWKTDDALPSTTNPNSAWSFGRTWSATDATFDLLLTNDEGGGWWMGNWGHGAPNIRPGLTVWAKDNSNGLPTTRWTCPTTDTYTIATSFWGADSRGVNVLVYITLNNTIIYQGSIHAYQETIQSNLNGLTLSQGDIIEYIVQWNGGVYSEYNWTGISSTISN